jgi:hypothetical protein
MNEKKKKEDKKCKVLKFLIKGIKKKTGGKEKCLKKEMKL